MKRTILFVDGDREFCKAMKRAFEKSGYSVTAVFDGKEAIALLEKSSFDLIISEVKIPRSSGVELMEAARKTNGDSSVIFLTAYGEFKSNVDLMNMGAYDYIDKPVRLEELLKIAGEALDEHAEFRDRL